MNLCSVCTLLCLVGSPAAGLVAGVERGAYWMLGGAALGGVIGLAGAIGIGFLEGVTTPRKERPPILSYGTVTLMAPIVAAAAYGGSAFIVRVLLTMAAGR